MTWLTKEQMSEMGFSCFGDNLMLSEKASYYNCKNIRLGDNVRVDDFCVLSAGSSGINIGNYVHIAVNVSIIGGGLITLSDFSGISARCAIYSSNDDYSGLALTGPTVPIEFTNVNQADVKVGRHVVIGAGSIVLPGVTLEEGAVVGALSLVNRDCQSFGIYVGVPVKRIGERKRYLLELEKELTNSKSST